MKTAYMLKTVTKNMTAHQGFRWPTRGKVKAPNWDPKPRCGSGLHGLLDGEGDGSLLDWSDTAKWLVVKIDRNKAVELNGKIKVPEGSVVHCGDQRSATQYLRAKGLTGTIVGCTSTSGHGGTSTSGYRGTSTSGDGGTSTSGDQGASTSGYQGTSTSGNWGTSTSGDWGTSISGPRGTSVSGPRGTSTSGDGGMLLFKWWDGERYRISTFYVGEDGIEPNVAYGCKAGKVIKMQKKTQ